MREVLKAYKGFDKNFKCQGFQYEVGKTYEMDKEEMQICVKGFHFCPNLVNCFDYYSPLDNSRFAEVEILGENIIEKNKGVTNKIKIVRELSKEEIENLVNIGWNNLGVGNVGNYNESNYNYGSKNQGGYNYGDNNSGYNNYGKQNKGMRNYGQFNSGSTNYGYENYGDENYGHQNLGDRNFGSNNFGSYNYGRYNLGSFNYGDFNIGSYNYGYGNLGNYNFGDFNKVNGVRGCFNISRISDDSKIMFFHRPVTDREFNFWLTSNIRRSLINILEHCKNCNIKNIDKKFLENYEETLIKGWNATVSLDNFMVICEKTIPNFNEEIFFVILNKLL